MYRKGNNLFLKHWDFIMGDIICLQFAFFLSYILRHGWGNPYEVEIYRSISIFIVLFYVCAVFFVEPHSGILRRGYFEEYKSVVKLVTVLILLCFAYMFFVQEGDEFSRIVFAEMWGISIIMICFVRIGMKPIVRKLVVNGGSKREVILISSNANARKMLDEIQEISYRDFRISGLILADAVEGEVTIKGVPVVATLEDGLEYLRSHVADEVLIDLPQETAIPRNVISGCLAMGITVHLNLFLMSYIGGQKLVEQFAERTVLTSSVRMALPKHVFYKRLLDIIGGVVGLIGTGVLCVFVAPIIWRQSPGPIFFSQYRIGKNGRKFKIYKFRSMYTDAEERKEELMAKNEVKGLMFKMENDPRIFPFGHFIRKTSIDEFPQFWNVLKGDMSLVGTRPPTVDEYERYEYHHKKRLSIKPGITGLWQVSGRSQIKDFEEVVKLDEKYIMNWTFAGDIRILLKTVKIVVRGRGAS